MHHRLFPDVEGEGHGFVDPIVQTIDETAGGPVTEAIGDHPLGHHGFIGTSLSPRRLWVVFGVFFLMLCGLTARAGYLDLHKGEEYRSLAEGNRLEFRDFGVFETKRRKPRVAQNPRTLERVHVPVKWTVKFKVGRLMKERVGL